MRRAQAQVRGEGVAAGTDVGGSGGRLCSEACAGPTALAREAPPRLPLLRSLPPDLTKLVAVWRKFEADRRAFEAGDMRAAAALGHLVDTPGARQLTDAAARLKEYLANLVQAFLDERLTLEQFSVLNGGEPWGNFIGVLSAWETPLVSKLQPPNIPALRDLLDALRELRSLVRRGERCSAAAAASRIPCPSVCRPSSCTTASSRRLRWSASSRSCPTTATSTA